MSKGKILRRFQTHTKCRRCGSMELVERHVSFGPNTYKRIYCAKCGLWIA